MITLLQREKIYISVFILLKISISCHSQFAFSSASGTSASASAGGITVTATAMLPGFDSEFFNPLPFSGFGIGNAFIPGFGVVNSPRRQQNQRPVQINVRNPQQQNKPVPNRRPVNPNGRPVNNQKQRPVNRPQNQNINHNRPHHAIHQNNKLPPQQPIHNNNNNHANQFHHKPPPIGNAIRKPIQNRPKQPMRPINTVEPIQNRPKQPMRPTNTVAKPPRVNVPTRATILVPNNQPIQQPTSSRQPQENTSKVINRPPTKPSKTTPKINTPISITTPPSNNVHPIQSSTLVPPIKSSATILQPLPVSNPIQLSTATKANTPISNTTPLTNALPTEQSTVLPSILSPSLVLQPLPTLTLTPTQPTTIPTVNIPITCSTEKSSVFPTIKSPVPVVQSAVSKPKQCPIIYPDSPYYIHRPEYEFSDAVSKDPTLLIDPRR